MADKPALKAAAEVAIKQGFGVWTGPDSAYSYGGSVLADPVAILELLTENARLLAELEAARSEIRDLETQVFELQMGDDL